MSQTAAAVEVRTGARGWVRNLAALGPLLALAGLAAGVFLLPRVDQRSNLGYELMNLAESLARDGTFSDPLASAATGPTATEPPLYPMMLALEIKLLRDVGLVLLAAGVTAIFANAAAAMVLHALVRRQLGTRAAWIAAGLWLASAWLGSSVNWVFWDAGITPLLVVGFCAAASDRAIGWRAVLVAGTLAGAIFLMNPAALVVAAAWWLTRRMDLRRTAGMCLVAAAVGSPWVIRNYALWGRPIARENFGFTFYFSNNPCAGAHLGENFNNCNGHTHPNGNAEEAARMRRLGEVEYDREQRAAAWAWIRANPGRFAGLTARRVLYFWFPWPFEYKFQSYATWLVTLLSIPGLVWMWKRRAPLAGFVLAAAAWYPAVYYIVVADIRYRAPFAWVAVIPAAYLCDRVWARVRA